MIIKEKVGKIPPINIDVIKLDTPHALDAHNAVIESIRKDLASRSVDLQSIYHQEIRVSQGQR